MSATVENITTEQSVTYTKVFTYTNSWGVDPADYTAAMDFRERKSATSAALSVTTTVNANGSVISLGGSAASITITISVADEDMAELSAKSYYYDILLTDTSGNVRRPFAGEVENILVVTR